MRKVLLMAVVAGLSACQTTGETPSPVTDGQAARVTLNGTVAYRERMALPPGARVHVDLSDVSRMDAPAIVIDQVDIKTEARQVPIPFSLSYDPARLMPNGRYAVSARITDASGKLMWITDTHFALPPAGTPAHLMLVRVPG